MAITNLFEFADSGLSNYQVCEVAVMESETFGYAIYFCGPGEDGTYSVQFNMVGLDMYASVDYDTVYELVKVFRNGRAITSNFTGHEKTQKIEQWRQQQMFPIVHQVFDFSLFTDDEEEEQTNDNNETPPTIN